MKMSKISLAVSFVATLTLLGCGQAPSNSGAINTSTAAPLLKDEAKS